MTDNPVHESIVEQPLLAWFREPEGVLQQHPADGASPRRRS